MPQKVVVSHDTDVDTPEQIEFYAHCSVCLKEKPPNVSPREYSHLQAGMTSAGHIQIVCARHGINVTLMSFELEEL